MRRLACTALAAAAVLGGLTACGSSDTPKSTEAFCSRLADLRDRNPLTAAASSEAAADEVATILDDLVRTSPQQIKADLRTFRRLVDDVRAIDPSDPTTAEAKLRALATPSVIQAGQSIATFARQECGFEDVFQGGG